MTSSGLKSVKVGKSNDPGIRSRVCANLSI
jgi:hypothetical protein